MRASVVLLGFGLAASAAVLLSALWWPADALAAWLAAAVAIASVPAGALILVMMMRLIPGAWGEMLRLSGEAAALTTPVAALAFLPLFFALAWLYPWVTKPPPSAFAAWWLSTPGFVIRTVAWFVYLGWCGWAMLGRRRTGVSAAIGLVLMPVLVHFVAVDWLMSRDLDFASSAFGLQIVSIMTTIAFCALLLLRHGAGEREIRTGVLGALLLTLLLIWAYLNFMAYLIVWSGNLPGPVGWYAMRGGDWSIALVAVVALNGIPLFLLLFRRFRSSPGPLALLAGAVLGGKLIELMWFAIPPAGGLAALLGLLAMAGAVSLMAGLLPLALRRRVESRSV